MSAAFIHVLLLDLSIPLFLSLPCSFCSLLPFLSPLTLNQADGAGDEVVENDGVGRRGKFMNDTVGLEIFVEGNFCRLAISCIT